MNVKELKEELSKYPDDMQVFLAERQTEFSFGLLNRVGSQDISFGEDEDDFDPEDEYKPYAIEVCVVLGED